jgi:hypothetical protein
LGAIRFGYTPHLQHQPSSNLDHFSIMIKAMIIEQLIESRKRGGVICAKQGAIDGSFYRNAGRTCGTRRSRFGVSICV